MADIVKRAVEGEVVNISCYNIVAAALPRIIYTCAKVDDRNRIEFRLERQAMVGADRYLYLSNLRNPNVNTARSINFMDEQPFIITPQGGEDWRAWSPVGSCRLIVIERRVIGKYSS
ncbi:MAG: hypothetical protein ABIJ56_18905 [Pseudomonadota bacterium]